MTKSFSDRLNQRHLYVLGKLPSLEKREKKRIVGQISRWSLALLSHAPVPDGEDPLYTKTRAIFAKASSGTRGGRLKNVRIHMLSIADMMELAERIRIRRHASVIQKAGKIDETVSEPI